MTRLVFLHTKRPVTETYMYTRNTDPSVSLYMKTYCYITRLTYKMYMFLKSVFCGVHTNHFQKARRELLGICIACWLIRKHTNILYIHTQYIYTQYLGSVLRVYTYRSLLQVSLYAYENILLYDKTHVQDVYVFEICVLRRLRTRKSEGGAGSFCWHVWLSSWYFDLLLSSWNLDESSHVI